MSVANKSGMKEEVGGENDCGCINNFMKSGE